MSDPRRVLLVGPLPPPSGGMANQTRQLQRLLRNDGLDVQIVQTNRPYRPEWIGGIRGLRAFARMVPYLAELWARCGEGRVVHVMANSGLAWDVFAAPAVRIARLRGCRVIVNYRGGLAPEFLSRAAGRVRRALEGTTLVVPSPFLRDIFLSHGMNARIIPNVVDAETFGPSPSRARRVGDGPRIIVARNLEHIYGNDLALRAVALLRRAYPALTCSIAGSGPDEGTLRALARELQIDGCVRFTGRLEVTEMVDLYHSADVVLNPVRADNTPNSVLEALSCGVPVVSTRVGGVPHLVTDGVSALLVDPESPEALAAGVDRVLRDDALRMHLVEGGRALVDGFAWSRVGRQWQAAYAGHIEVD